MAELDVLKESIEKQRIVDTLLSNDRRYRKYTMDEIKLATNFFAEDLIIGEGSAPGRNQQERGVSKRGPSCA